MKKSRIILCISSFAMVACLSIGATFAWLTAQTSTLTNTFTVGNIGITLDEEKVEGNVPQGSRTEEGNEYTIYNDAELPKDPTVTVKADSENCYVFMSCIVPDELKSIISEINIDEENWKAVNDEETLFVYTGGETEAKIVEKSDTDEALAPLFTTVTIGTVTEDFEPNDIVVKSLAYYSGDGSVYADAEQFAKDNLL